MVAIPLVETPRLTIPKLGFGTYGLTGADGQAAIESAIDVGYTHLDTAAMYGNEVEVGAAIAASGKPRDALFVTTKVWHDSLTTDGIPRAMDVALGKLKLDYVNLFMIHWPNAQMDLPEALHALVRVQESGLARAIGVANFPLGLLRRTVEEVQAPIACLQVEYHAMLSQDRLLDYLKPHGLPLTAYSPLGKGNLAKDPVLARIGEKHGVTAAQVGLAWLLQQDKIVPIPKASRRESQQANLGALSVRLDAEDRAAIAALPKGKRYVSPPFAPDWAA